MKAKYYGEGQDYIAHELIGESGFYLDIGCAEPIKKNNTYALELLGWHGICIDKNNFTAQYQKYRPKTYYFCENVLRVDWSRLLQAYSDSYVIDFISMDVDDANIELMQSFPFDRFEFKVLCFETDEYNCGDKRKKVAEEVLAKYPQYYRLIDGVMIKGLKWEDCWVNEKYVDLKDRATQGIEYKDFKINEN